MRVVFKNVETGVQATVVSVIGNPAEPLVVNKPDLPENNYEVSASAHGDTAGNGTVLASATGAITVRTGGVGEITLRLVAVSSDLLVQAAPGMSVRLPGTLELTASSTVFPISPGSIRWTSSAPSIAEVDATGNPVTVRSRGIGVVSIWAYDEQSRVSSVPIVIEVTGDAPPPATGNATIGVH